MRTVLTVAPWPCVHTTTRQLAKSQLTSPSRLRTAGATHAIKHPEEACVVVLSSVGETEATYHQLDIGQALATSIVAGIDLRTALGKLSNDTVILYWHPASNTSAIAFITTTRKDILSQKNAQGIDTFIRSKLLDEDEKTMTSKLWWSLTVPPDFDSRIRGRLPTSASQDTFESVVQQAACWILSEDLPDNQTS